MSDNRPQSSYNSEVDFLELIAAVIHTQQPKSVVEFGILKGGSLSTIVRECDNDVSIDAYDIFDEFNGNHADKQTVETMFARYKNVNVSYGDFFKQFAEIEDASLDLLHVDIANDGKVYGFCIDHYLPKVAPGGCILLEGGSAKRDAVPWMDKYGKPKIVPYLIQLAKRTDLDVRTFGIFPSITLVKRVKTAEANK